MLARDIGDKSWAHQVLALAISFLACMAIFGALVMLLIPAISTIPPVDFLQYTNYADKAYIQDLIVVQAIYTVGMFAAPAILYGIVASKNSTAYLGHKPAHHSSQYLWAVLAMLSSLGFVGLLAMWNVKLPLGEASVALEKKAELLTKAFLDIKTIPQLLLTLFYLALLPAIAEELFFRGALQSILRKAFHKHGVAVAISLTAILFGVMHGQMLSVLPRIFLGIVLGYIYYYSGSIYPCIVGHFANNGLQVILTYMHNTGKLALNVNDTPQVALWQGLLSLAAGLLFLLLLRRYAKPSEAQV